MAIRGKEARGCVFIRAWRRINFHWGTVYRKFLRERIVLTGKRGREAIHVLQVAASSTPNASIFTRLLVVPVLYAAPLCASTLLLFVSPVHIPRDVQIIPRKPATKLSVISISAKLARFSRKLKILSGHNWHFSWR